MEVPVQDDEPADGDGACDEEEDEGSGDHANSPTLVMGALDNEEGVEGHLAGEFADEGELPDEGDLEETNGQWR